MACVRAVSRYAHWLVALLGGSALCMVSCMMPACEGRSLPSKGLLCIAPAAPDAHGSIFSEASPGQRHFIAMGLSYNFYFYNSNVPAEPEASSRQYYIRDLQTHVSHTLTRSGSV
jgi:hypothetical protein